MTSTVSEGFRRTGTGVRIPWFETTLASIGPPRVLRLQRLYRLDTPWSTDK